jgi:hypothetical protein
MRVPRLLVCTAALIALAVAAEAQPKSAALAQELAKLLEEKQLTTIAAKGSVSADEADRYVAAMLFPGVQLLVVSARYSAPPYMTEKLMKKNYQDIYIDLNSASIPGSRVFITDLGINGLRPKREDNSPYDSYEAGGAEVAFDGDWRKKKMSEEDYMKRFSTAEDAYVRALTHLLAELKKAS